MANNTFLDTYDGANDSVYYKIFLNRDDYVTIVCLQDFDEDDYKQDRFFKIEVDGEQMCVAFYSEEKAKIYLNEKFQRQFIDPEYQTSQSLFNHMLKN
jgi:hypothetical protein